MLTPALYNSAKITPAVIEFVDIAGLVKGLRVKVLKPVPCQHP